MPDKVKIILNPMADMRNAWKTANDVRPLVSEYGGADWSGTVYPTHATELAKQAGEQGYDRVIAMGGDGTVHEVINGIMQLPEAPARAGRRAGGLRQRFRTCHWSPPAAGSRSGLRSEWKAIRHRPGRDDR